MAVILAACSGGTAQVKASPTTTAPSSDSSSASSKSTAAKKSAATKAAKKRAVAKSAAKSSATGSSKGSSGSASGSSSQSGGTVTVSTDTTPPTVGWNLNAARVTPAGGTTVQTAPASTPTTVKPFDPTKVVDLSGTPGVTAAQQARAEKLVRDTLRDLPRYKNVAAAYADGYRSINDGLTGSEHYVKWAYVDDDHILDSRYPESLVYQVRNGVKTLVSAMYMLRFGARFTDVPDVGGALTQWHIHSNLCLIDNPSDPLQKVVGSLTGADGSCPPGSTKAATSPMLHVWIVANPCGPFAALEGISAGEVPDGETRLCDTAHGSG